MVRTKGIGATVKGYTDAIGNVPGRYKDGIDRTTDWQANAIQAEGLWADKIQEAISDRSRERGLQRTSDGEWKQAAGGKGAARIGAGMRESLPKYQQAMGEVLSVIEGVSIPDRVADPMANVDNRVKPIVEALVNYKKSR